MDDDQRRRRLWIASAAIALTVVTILRIAYLRSLPGGGFFIKYLWFADEFLAGRLHRDRLADLSPAYAWMITLFRSAGFGEWTIRSLQVAMVSVVAGCAGAAAHRFGGWIAAITAAVIVLSNRAALVNASDFEPETLLIFFEALAIAIVVCSKPRMPAGVAATSGIMAGLAIVTRPVALLPAIILAAYLLYRSRRMPWLFAAAAVIPAAVVLIVNTRLTGDTVLMDPGTVFYEGMNPRATGCTGTLPRIIGDLEPEFSGPDTLHVAYRFVAARAAGKQTISRQESNRWWAGRASAFARHEPLQAAKLTLRKAGAALQSRDIWDVPSMAILDRAMTAPMWIPWAIVIAFALAALLVARREAAVLFGILAAAAALPMLVFFVSGRHRNPLLVPAAILAALAVEGIWRGLRSSDRTRPAAALVLAALAAALLSVETSCARADDYYWRSFNELRAAGAGTGEALRRGDTSTAALLQAYAHTWNADTMTPVDKRLLEKTARGELARATDVQRMFRIAIALDDAGARSDSQRLLAAVHENDPQPTPVLPPPSWYLARSFARSNDLHRAGAWLATARRLAPGNADVLALAAVLTMDQDAAGELRQLHDPFTAALAIDEARLALCRSSSCTEAVNADLNHLTAALPQWHRPAAVAQNAVLH